MDRTLEVRWFLEGPAPYALTDWMDTLNASAESPRTDRYLVSHDGGMNVKLREGQVQTKRRLAGPTPLSFSDSVRGYQEHWVKWSFPMTEDTEGTIDQLQHDPTGLWVPVYKERRQRFFAVEDYDTLLDAPLQTPTHSKVELTTVQTGDHHAHTICIEAEGTEEALQDTLEAVGRALFHQAGAPALHPNASFGYAKWLATLAAKNELPTDAL